MATSKPFIYSKHQGVTKTIILIDKCTLFWPPTSLSLVVSRFIPFLREEREHMRTNNKMLLLKFTSQEWVWHKCSSHVLKTGLWESHICAVSFLRCFEDSLFRFYIQKHSVLHKYLRIVCASYSSLSFSHSFFSQLSCSLSVFVFLLYVILSVWCQFHFYISYPQELWLLWLQSLA